MRRSHSLYLSVTTVLVAAALWLAWLEPAPGSLYGRLQGLALDARLPAPARVEDGRIVIVDINEESLAAEGRWPWPRGQVAELVERLLARGVAVVGLDILFPEPGDLVGDAALARQLARPEVVGAVAFAPGAGDSGLPVAPGGLVSGSGPGSGVGGLSPSGQPAADTGGGPVVAMAGLAHGLRGENVALGHITPLYDADFVIRRLRPLMCGDDCYHTLAAAMLARWSDIPPVLADDRYCVAGFCQRLNPDGTLSVPYHHPSRFAYLSASTVLRGSQPLPQLEGAMVLVGTSAVGLGDRVATPLSASTPGVEIHAKVLAGMLDNVYWSRLPGDRVLITLAILVIALAALAWPWLAGRAKIAVMAIAVLLVAAPLALPLAGYWVDALPLWFAVAALAAMSGGWEIDQVLSQRRKIYRAFAAYVPPVVLRTLVKQGLGPDRLDAQRADVTVFFADIQGFTSLSEHLEPEQLVEITSHLFTGITEEIHRHKGTLDKFMGDAVMAFWGAPLPQDNHPRLALDCALAVSRRLEQMSRWCRERGYPEVKMTMGLESGVVTVGNLGSRQRRAYTILGKTVNLASHLQQQCRQLGHDILCGPELCQRLGEGQVALLPPTEIRGIEGLQVVGYPVAEAAVR